MRPKWLSVRLLLCALRAQTSLAVWLAGARADENDTSDMNDGDADRGSGEILYELSVTSRLELNEHTDLISFASAPNAELCGQL